jgi:hypothetical protein
MVVGKRLRGTDIRLQRRKIITGGNHKDYFRNT